VRLDGADVMSTGGYTRGLSVSADHVLVGSSRLHLDRRVREQGDGHVHIMATDFSVVGRVTVPATQIHEIRRVDAAELGMSNEAGPAVAFTRAR
jgi:hypothetical protein